MAPAAHNMSGVHAGSVTDLKSRASEDAGDWQLEFQERALRIHQELCEDPERRSRKDCVDFLASMSQPKAEEGSGSVAPDDGAAVGGDSEDPKAWSHTFMEVVRETQRQMCLEPHRRGREDCRELLASMPAETHVETEVEAIVKKP